MNEEKKISIVENIKEKLKYEEVLKEKENQINELEKDEKIIQYLSLKKELEELEKQRKINFSKEQMINMDFFKEFNNSCNHDIYVYIGSYRIETDFPNTSCLREGKLSNESCVNFTYNKYVCLSCGLIIEVSNWEEFEENNIVFKNYKNINVSKYRQLYFELLFNHTVEEANKLIINEYIKNEKVSIQKKLTKSK